MLNNIQIVGKITLKELRKLAGLSQKEMADKVKIPLTTYRRYESDTASMEVGRLFYICDVFDLSVNQIKL